MITRNHEPSLHARTFRTLPALLALIVPVLLALPASALYVDFADYQGMQSGSQANISAHGLSITIDSYPSDFNLSITDAGLGVECTAGFWGCFTNQPDQIDAEWQEAIVITFNDGPVSLSSVDLSRIYSGEIAVVATASAGAAVMGDGTSEDTANYTVDMGGVIADRFVVSTWGWFSDAALRGMEFELIGEPVRPIDPTPGGGPGSAIPEPSAALLFFAGIATVATRRRVA